MNVILKLQQELDECKSELKKCRERLDFLFHEDIYRGFELPYVLLVEGKDDLHFFNFLIKHFNLPDFDIRWYRGKDYLEDVLGSLVITPGFAEKVVSIGITRDANSNPEGAFESICKTIKKTKPDPPCKPWIPPKHPLELSNSQPKIGIMIFPNSNSKGMLEDICLESVKEDPAMLCIDEYFGCLKKKGLKLPNEIKISKSKTQAFLASREKCKGYSLGVAAQREIWPVNYAFKEIEQFLKLLCSCS